MGFESWFNIGPCSLPLKYTRSQVKLAKDVKNGHSLLKLKFWTDSELIQFLKNPQEKFFCRKLCENVMLSMANCELLAIIITMGILLVLKKFQ